MSPGLAYRCGSECIGTALLVGLGTGAIVLGAREGGASGSALALAWFAAVAVPIQLFAFVSGAHLNPAVTLGVAAAGRFPLTEAPAYAGSQFAGAFLASLMVRALLGGAGHLGATLPGPSGPLPVVPLEFGFTLALVLSVLVLFGLERPARRLELLLPAAVVGLSTLMIGPWTGSSLNPARSMAPAVVSGDLHWIGLYLGAAILAALVAAAIGRRTVGPAEPGARAASRLSKTVTKCGANLLGFGTDVRVRPFAGRPENDIEHAARKGFQ